MHPLIPILGHEVPAYGLALLAALAAGIALAAVEARRRGHAASVAWDGALWVVPAALLGAHLPYWIAGALRGGGMRGASYPAALAAATLALVAFARRRGIEPADAFDTCAPAAALGHAIGRAGCFLAGCCWGRATDVPWAVTFTDPAAFAPRGIPLHPTQLYELALELGIFAVLWRRRLRPHRPGSQALVLGMAYGVGRLVIEAFRGDPGRGDFVPGLSLTQAAAALLAAGCGIAWIASARGDRGIQAA